MRCAIVFLDPGLPVALELLLPRFGLLMPGRLKSDETLKIEDFCFVAQSGSRRRCCEPRPCDGCGWGSVCARMAQKWSPLSALRRGDLCMLVSFVTGSTTGNYFVLGSIVCKLCSRK